MRKTDRNCEKDADAMEQRKTGLNSNQLKLIALFAMTVDHVTCVVVPGYPKIWWILLLHVVGRLAAVAAVTAVAAVAAVIVSAADKRQRTSYRQYKR